MTGNIFSKQTTDLLDLIKTHAKEVADLAARYDDALRVINNQAAELEYLRNEQRRRVE